MLERLKTDYHHTLHASYFGYITQAIINNFLPLLFLTLRSEFGFSLAQVTLITTVNFEIQLCVDLASAFFVDKIGYRASAVAAHVLSALGLIGLTFLPSITASPYTGLMICVVCYAIGGGLIEVLISPIVESCPTERKEATMSLLHSFYCWGHAGLVLVCTAFFAIFGIANWRVLACILALCPVVGAVCFLFVPIYPVVAENTEKMPLKKLLTNGTFWLLMLLMVCAGASEQAMSQWTSAFAESGLHVSKTIGDIAGSCAFAILMGTARALYGKKAEQLPLKRTMMLSAVLCIACYLLAAHSGNPLLALIGCAVCGFSVGIFWPGTFSLAAKALPGGGTALFALMALGGDIGCSGGPTVVGLVANAQGGALKAGLTVAIIFPLLMLLALTAVKKK